MERINNKTEKYLSQSQSAYREFRNISNIVWAYRWLTSRTEKYKEKIYITGIDISSAFDTIKRKGLIDIVRTFLEEDEVRMIRYLLANTSLDIRLYGAKTEPYSSNIGSPQGDGPNGKLFSIYFEKALKEVREV